jgi:hypothetical protein
MRAWFATDVSEREPQECSQSNFHSIGSRGATQLGIPSPIPISSHPGLLQSTPTSLYPSLRLILLQLSQLSFHDPLQRTSRVILTRSGPPDVILRLVLRRIGVQLPTAPIEGQQFRLTFVLVVRVLFEATSVLRPNDKVKSVRWTQ